MNCVLFRTTILAALVLSGCAVGGTHPTETTEDVGPADAPPDLAALFPNEPLPDMRAASDLTANDVGSDAAPDAANTTCAPGVPGCTCVTGPPAAGSCEHTYGGMYGDGACSGSFQCCGGGWKNCTDCCGTCTCRETTGLEGCTAPGTEEEVCFPEWDGTSGPIPQTVRDQMIGKSWHFGLGCPSLDSLSFLQMPHFDFAGEVRRGELIVAADQAANVLQVFRKLYEARFPIERMVLVDEYDGDDDASMAANNTSAFNCRQVTGGTSLSAHSYGIAIDINPVQNPYVNGGTVLPDSGAAYTDRANVRPGMIVRPGVVVNAFEEVGWSWGGDFNSLKDYQHFSSDGR